MTKTWKPNVVLATPDQLRDPQFIQRVAITLWCLRYQDRPASRRTIPDLCADVMRDFEGSLVEPNGDAYEVPEVDAALGAENDPEFTWLREFLKFAMEPPIQRLPQKSQDRVKYLDAVIRAGGPTLWRGQH